MRKKLKKYISKILRLLKRDSSPRRYKYLYETIRRIRPVRIMEIGVWNGRRASKMIRLAQEFNDDIHYFGTDLFEEMDDVMMVEELSKRPPSKEEVYTKLKNTGAKIRLIVGNTLISLPGAINSLPKMDFVFIDGGHAVETIESDWRHVRELMHGKTVVIFDDYYEDRDDLGAKSVIEDIDRDTYNVDILPIQDVFKKEYGLLKINFVKVTKRNN